MSSKVIVFVDASGRARGRYHYPGCYVLDQDQGSGPNRPRIEMTEQEALDRGLKRCAAPGGCSD